MEQVGTDDEGLLGAWRQGWRRDLYAAVREPMYQAASQGIGSITSSKPDPQDVEDTVYDAFVELERQDHANVISVVGLARKIAYRRGQDTGRRIIREREQMHKLMVDLIVTNDQQFHDEDVRDAAAREVLIGHALECMGALTEEQRDVVRATIMGHESLSDWALRNRKSHQAASRQRIRAVDALHGCVQSKRSANRGGGKR